MFHQMAAAYSLLHSYCATLDVADQNEEGKSRPSVHAKITFQRPDQATVVTNLGGKPRTETVTDGVHTFVTSHWRGQTRYLEEPAPPTSAIDKIFTYGIEGFVPFPSECLTGYNVFKGQNPQGMLSLSRGPKDIVSGVLVETVVMRFRIEGTGVFTQTFAIGQADHLLYRMMNVLRRTNGHADKETVTFSQVTVNRRISSNRFVFLPPPGAVPVASVKALLGWST